MISLRALVVSVGFMVSVHAWALELVTPDNFKRAETDYYFKRKVDAGMFGKFGHLREAPNVEKQLVVRTNRDTLYSYGIFDLSAPVIIVKPDTGARFQSMVVLNEDHYIKQVAYAPGEYMLTREQIGTRYVHVAFRTLVDPADPVDVKAVHAIQDKIQWRQTAPGKFEIPEWDPVSQKRIRDALNLIGTTLADSRHMFGDVNDVDPVRHLIGTAAGWGGAPESASMYLNFTPEKNDGNTPYVLKVRDVPVDGFWSVSLYNADGYFQKNDVGSYSFNNLTARRDSDGAVTIHFGGDPKQTNYLPIAGMNGWNYTVRLYRPHKEILNGTWKFPSAQPGQ